MPVSISTEKCGQARGASAGTSNSSHASSGAVGSATSMSLRSLHGAGVGQQLVVGQQQAIADAQFGPVLAGEQPAEVANVDDGVLRRALRLAVEEVGDRRHGVELELLVGVELQLHGPSSSPSLLDAFDLLLEVALERPVLLDAEGRVLLFGQSLGHFGGDGARRWSALRIR